MLDRMRQVLFCLLLSTLIVLSVYASLTIRDARTTVIELRDSARETKEAAKAVRQFAEFQSQQLQSAESQKLLRLNLAVGAAAIGTIRLLNTTTIPALNRSVEQLGTTGQALTELTRNTDTNLNQSLLPEATRTTARLGKSIEDTSVITGKSVARIAESTDTLLRTGIVSAEELAALMADPAWKKAINNVENSTAEMAATSKNVTAISREAADATKEVNAAIKEYRKASSRYGKLYWIARILGALW